MMTERDDSIIITSDYLLEVTLTVQEIVVKLDLR